MLELDQGAGRPAAGGPVSLAVFNVMKDSFSVASLGLPFAFKSAGAGLATLLVVLIGAASGFTAVLLSVAGRAAAPFNGGRRAVTYTRLGAVAFGRPGELAVFWVATLTCVGAAAGWFIVIGHSFHDATSGAVGYNEAVFLSLAVILPLCWLRDVHALGYAGALSAALFLGLLGLLSHEAAGAGDARPPASFLATVPGQGAEQALVAFGIVKFTMAGHEVFLSVEQGLRRREQYTAVMCVSFTFMVLFDLAIGGAGYAAFGYATQSNVMRNLSPGGVGRVARYLVGSMLVLTVPIVLLAAFEAVEEVAVPRWPRRLAERSKDAPLLALQEAGDDGDAAAAAARPSLLARVLVRTPVTAASVLVAVLAADRFAHVIGLVGAVGDSFPGLIFPCALYLRLRAMGGGRARDDAPASRVAAAWGTLALGAVGVLSGVFMFVTGTDG